MQGDPARRNGRLCVSGIEIQRVRSRGECLGIPVPHLDLGRKPGITGHPVHGQCRLPPSVYEICRPRSFLHCTGLLGDDALLSSGTCACTPLHNLEVWSILIDLPDVSGFLRKEWVSFSDLVRLVCSFRR